MAGQVGRNRAFAVFLLFFEIGMLFAYGFGVHFYVETANDGIAKLVPYIFVGLFALLGWGLVISYSSGSMVTGLLTTLLVVVVSMQLQPLMSEFWFMCYNGFAKDLATIDYWKYYQGNQVLLAAYTAKVSMIMVASELVAFTAIIGKVGPFETLIITVLYNVGWSLALFTIEHVFWYNGDQSTGAFDDYGGNYIYVFAGIFGIIVSALLHCKPANANNLGATFSKESGFIALAGTGLIFATFPFTGVLTPITQVSSTTAAAFNLRQYEGPINIYFALSASVIVTYWISSIIGGGKVGIREALLGTLSGGVIIACCASWISNIGACICVGAFAGLFSGFWLRVVLPKMNRIHIVDNLGLLGPIFIIAALGTFVVSSVSIGAYEGQTWNPATFTGNVTSNTNSRLELGFFAITCGAGLFFGLIAGIFSCCTRSDRWDFNDRKWIQADFGLFNENTTTPGPVNPQVVDTQQQLKNQYAL